LEGKFVEYVYRTNYDDIPATAIAVIKNQLLGIFGTTVAGASAEGVDALLQLTRSLGGKEEATILIHGGKATAQQAAFVNAVMARALDFCDALAPGAHIGSSVVPAALAAAELMGGCNGKDFLAAITVGNEAALRLNFGESEYDGFDPTGVCVVFAATVAAAKILRLSEKETWNALALAFNRCGGSFQSNVDGSLAVRVIQGWVAESGVMCARFASKGITGPANFLSGVYGYLHLFGRDRIAAETVSAKLGEQYLTDKLVYKKYPSCGLTQGCTEVILNLMKEEGIGPDDIGRVYVTVPPYTYKLVGSNFQVGNNPKVNAQFSIQFCVANALLRGGSKLAHFEEAAIREPEILKLTEKVEVISEPALELVGHTPLEMRVVLKDGKELFRKMDEAPGFPKNPLTAAEHQERFQSCMEFATDPLPKEKTEELMGVLAQLETMEDVRNLIPILQIYK